MLLNVKRALILCLLCLSPLSHAAAPLASTAPVALALQDLPLVYQGYNDCGPATIAMVLGYYGYQVDVTEISKATKPSPKSYMQVAQIGTYVAPYGLEAVLVQHATVEQLQAMIRLGVPAIALQYYREVGKVPHFRVVRGYDRNAQWLYLADPLAGYARISYQDFNTLWNMQSRVFVAVYPRPLRAAVLRSLRPSQGTQGS